MTVMTRLQATGRLTNVMFQPIHIVRLDERTGNVFILTGQEETIVLQIKPTGELI